MKRLLFLLIFLPGIAQAVFQPNPKTPDEVWQNDLDLQRQINILQRPSGLTAGNTIYIAYLYVGSSGTFHGPLQVDAPYLFTSSGPARFGVGTNATPSIAAIFDPTSGINFPVAGVVDVDVGGTLYVHCANSVCTPGLGGGGITWGSSAKPFAINATTVTYQDGTSDTTRHSNYTGWTVFTPTGSWTTNTTYTGYYRRRGSVMEAFVHIALAGAPTSANLTIAVPLGLSINTGIPQADVTVTPYGEGGGSHSGAYIFNVTYNSAVSVIAGYEGALTGALTIVNATSPVVWANGDFLDFHFYIPINSWTD